MVSKAKPIKPKDFYVIGERGYFAGLYKGGMFRWTYDISEAKPLSHIEQFETIKRGMYGEELIQEFVNSK